MQGMPKEKRVAIENIANGTETATLKIPITGFGKKVAVIRAKGSKTFFSALQKVHYQ